MSRIKQTNSIIANLAVVAATLCHFACAESMTASSVAEMRDASTGCSRKTVSIRRTIPGDDYSAEVWPM
jgi:hypothetical protein